VPASVSPRPNASVGPVTVIAYHESAHPAPVAEAHGRSTVARPPLRRTGGRHHVPGHVGTHDAGRHVVIGSIGSCTPTLRFIPLPQNGVKCPHLTTSWREQHHGVTSLCFSYSTFYTHLLFVVLHLTWPQRPVGTPATPTQPESLTPTRHRSNEPKPFAGLTHKPHCAWDCATANVHDTHFQPLITPFDGHMMSSPLGVLGKQGEHCSPRDRTKRATRNLVAVADADHQLA